MSSAPIDVSIVVPVYNEHAYLQKHENKFADWQCDGVELIFVDGGSNDATATYLDAHGYHVLHSAPGRAKQMNAGAAHSRGQVLWFLHVDTTLPCAMSVLLPHIQTALGHEGCAGSWGFFCIQLDCSQWIFRAIAAGINGRSKIFHVASGDQGIFVKREIFEAWGGFADIPLMEDIEFSRRAKRRAKPSILAQTLTTSARRWQSRGVLKTILLMWGIQLAYKCGVSPVRLQSWYR